MGEAKFTKGEWRLGMVAGKFNISVVDSGSQLICEMPKTPIYDEHVRSNIFGNTHLIAAAPEMYGLLEEIMLSEASTGKDDGYYEEIKKLLAKARGEG